jgi:flagellar protein FlaG
MKISDLASLAFLQKSGIARELSESARSLSPTTVADTVAVSSWQVQPVQESGSIGATREQSEQQLDEAIAKANRFLQDDNRALQFVKDKDSDRIVVVIKDTKTNEVIQQIPSEAMLRLSRQLEQLQGILFEEKV